MPEAVRIETDSTRTRVVTQQARHAAIHIGIAHQPIALE